MYDRTVNGFCFGQTRYFNDTLMRVSCESVRLWLRWGHRRRAWFDSGSRRRAGLDWRYRRGTWFGRRVLKHKTRMNFRHIELKLWRCVEWSVVFLMFWSQKDNQSNRKFQSSVEQSNFKFHFFFPTRESVRANPALEARLRPAVCQSVWTRLRHVQYLLTMSHTSSYKTTVGNWDGLSHSDVWIFIVLADESSDSAIRLVFAVVFHQVHTTVLNPKYSVNSYENLNCW